MHQKPTPTVGRVVHYLPPDAARDDTKPYAATIAEVENEAAGVVTLYVIDPVLKTTHFIENVSPAAEPSPGHWHWPLIVAPPAASVP